jgi:hypothetical protein
VIVVTPSTPPRIWSTGRPVRACICAVAPLTIVTASETMGPSVDATSSTTVVVPVMSAKVIRLAHLQEHCLRRYTH